MVLIREDTLLYLNLPDFLNTFGSNPQNDKESTIDLRTLTFKKVPTIHEFIRGIHNEHTKQILWKLPLDAKVYFKGDEGYFSQEDVVLVDLTEHKDTLSHIREAATMFADAYYAKRHDGMGEDMSPVDDSKLSVFKEVKGRFYLQLAYPKRSITPEEKEALRNGTTEIVVHPKSVFYMDPTTTKDYDYPVGEATYYLKCEIHNTRFESPAVYKKRMDAIAATKKELQTAKRSRGEVVEDEGSEEPEKEVRASSKTTKRAKKTAPVEESSD